MLKINLLNEIQVEEKFCAKNCSSKFFQNDLILSIVEDGKYLAIWDPKNNSCKGFVKGSHQQRLSSFALSPSAQHFLCTCSEDRVIVWPTQNLQESGSIVALNLGRVDFCTFSWDNQWLALCSIKQIMVIQLKFHSETSQQLECVKEQELIETNVHENNLCDFSPTEKHLMIYLDDTNSFKIRDVYKCQLLYRSFTLISHSITWMRFSHQPFNRVLICTNKSIVQVYNLNLKSLKPRLIAKIDESSRTFINKESSSQEKDKEISGQCGCLLFGAYLLNPLEAIEENPSNSMVIQTRNIYEEIIHAGPLLVIYSNLGVSIYDCNSWNLFTFFSFEALNLEKHLLTFLTCIDFITTAKSNIKCLLKSSIFSKVVHVVTLELNEEKVETKISSLSPSPKCVAHLKNGLPVRRSSSEHQLCTVPTFLNPSRVRSSGYGAAHRGGTRMFIPNTNLTKLNKKRQNKQTRTNNSSSNSSSSQWSNHTRTIHRSDSEFVKYLKDAGPPERIVKKIQLGATRGSQMRISHSGDGTQLAYGSTQKIIHLLNAKELNEMRNNDVLIGHDQHINSIHFSLCGNYLASNSEKLIKIWDIKYKKCMLNIDPQTQKINNTRRLSKNVTRRPSSETIQNVQFFYKDQFLLHTLGSSLYLNLLSVDSRENTTLPNVAAARAVSKIPLATQQINSFSALNYRYSNIVICGCSNKSVHVLDLNEEKSCLTLEDVHLRVPHLVRHLAWSPTPFDHPSPLCDLFLTTAINDGVKLWDLRSARCVQKYSSHCNKMYTTRFDVSPCARYLAVGGEDNSLYLYDTRSNVEWLTRWSGLGSPVLDVSFNPGNPSLAAATLNGSLLLFGH